jgi:hypothetical protein
MAMSPPQGKKNCAKAPPLGIQIGIISPPPGNNIDCRHRIITCKLTCVNNINAKYKKEIYDKDKDAFILMQHCINSQP